MDISSWLIHTCTLKRSTGRHPTKGDPLYTAPPVTFSARVEKKVAMVRSATGETVSSAFVMMTEMLILPDDRVWFPSIAGEPADDVNKPNAAHTPIAIETATDKVGLTYVRRVWF